jgi:hypothetical protein
MENELKTLLAKFESNYYAVNWDNMPLPSLSEQKKNVIMNAIIPKEPLLKK